MMLQAPTTATSSPATLVQVTQGEHSTVILVIALIAEFLLLFLLVRLYAPKLKDFLKDFPTHPASVVTALALILAFGVVVLNKLVLGQPIPDSYEFFMWGMIALAGVNVGGLAVKRFSDYRYREIKNQATQEFQIPADKVNVNVAAPAATPAPAKPPAATPPRAGEAPSDPGIRESLEQLAARQRERAAPDDVPGEGD